MSKKYSVLMSVYYKEKAEYLRESMQSIYNQTIPTDDFVLICDGPLTEELNKVVEEMQELFGDRLNVHRLEKNVGLGNALNIGIQLCKNELIARMDSDDISYKDRCEKQIRCFEIDIALSMTSGVVEEFSESIRKIDAKRVVPENHNQIFEFAKKRNPFNHPCIMYKKSAVLKAGSYQDFYLLEDYFLWIRMLMQGYRGYNLQEPILYMRAGNEMYKRRSGISYIKSQKKLFMFMKDKKFITESEYIKAILVRSVSALLPNCFRKTAFKIVLRK